MFRKLLVAFGLVVALGFSSSSAMAMNFFDNWNGFGVDINNNVISGVGFTLIDPWSVELTGNSSYPVVGFKSNAFSSPVVLKFDFSWMGTTGAFAVVNDNNPIYDSTIDAPFVANRQLSVTPGDTISFYVMNFDGMEGVQDTFKITNVPDVTPTPIPAPIILFGSGLAGLQLLRYRKWRK